MRRQWRPKPRAAPRSSASGGCACARLSSPPSCNALPCDACSICWLRAHSSISSTASSVATRRCKNGLGRQCGCREGSILEAGSREGERQGGGERIRAVRSHLPAPQYLTVCPSVSSRDLSSESLDATALDLAFTVGAMPMYGAAETACTRYQKR